MPITEKRLITRERVCTACWGVAMAAVLLQGVQAFQWDWRHSEALDSRQSLRRAKIPAAEREALAKAIAIQLKPDLGGSGGETDSELEDTALDTAVKFVDLNGDGTPEVIAQGSVADGGCNPAGNCRFWILQKSDGAFRLLNYQPDIQSFNMENSRSNGFTDLAVRTYDSTTHSTVRLLQYRQGGYQEAACFDANWSVAEGNTVHELKEPRLTACPKPSAVRSFGVRQLAAAFPAATLLGHLR